MLAYLLICLLTLCLVWGVSQGETTCQGIESTDPSVCSGHGACVSTDTCSCASGWSSMDCSQAQCSTDCNNHGKCVSPEICECSCSLFYGEACQHVAPTIVNRFNRKSFGACADVRFDVTPTNRASQVDVEQRSRPFHFSWKLLSPPNIDATLDRYIRSITSPVLHIPHHLITPGNYSLQVTAENPDHIGKTNLTIEFTKSGIPFATPFFYSRVHFMPIGSTYSFDVNLLDDISCLIENDAYPLTFDLLSIHPSMESWNQYNRTTNKFVIHGAVFDEYNNNMFDACACSKRFGCSCENIDFMSHRNYFARLDTVPSAFYRNVPLEFSAQTNQTFGYLLLLDSLIVANWDLYPKQSPLEYKPDGTVLFHAQNIDTLVRYVFISNSTFDVLIDIFDQENIPHSVNIVHSFPTAPSPLLTTKDEHIYRISDLNQHIDPRDASFKWSVAFLSSESTKFENPSTLFNLSSIDNTNQILKIPTSVIRSHIEKKELFNHAHMVVRVEITRRIDEKLFAIGNFAFSWDKEPSGGSLHISPLIGEAGTTRFTLSAVGWHNVHTLLPHFYSFSVVDPNSQSEVVLSSGISPYVNTEMPFFDLLEETSAQVILRVQSLRGETKTVKTNVLLHPTSKSQNDLLTQLEQKIQFTDLLSLEDISMAALTIAQLDNPSFSDRRKLIIQQLLSVYQSMQEPIISSRSADLFATFLQALSANYIDHTQQILSAIGSTLKSVHQPLQSLHTEISTLEKLVQSCSNVLPSLLPSADHDASVPFESSASRDITVENVLSTIDIISNKITEYVSIGTEVLIITDNVQLSSFLKTADQVLLPLSGASDTRSLSEYAPFYDNHLSISLAQDFLSGLTLQQQSRLYSEGFGARISLIRQKQFAYAPNAKNNITASTFSLDFLLGRQKFLSEGSQFSFSLPGKYNLSKLETNSYKDGIRPNCVYWDTVDKTWSSQGCIPTNMTSTSASCLCNHTTDFSVALDWLPAPNFIDPDVIKGKDSIIHLNQDNMATAIVMFSFWIVYFILMLIFECCYTVNSFYILFLKATNRYKRPKDVKLGAIIDGRPQYIRPLFQKLKSTHLWISVFCLSTRDDQSFNKSQRLTILSMLIMGIMMSNALSVGISNETQYWITGYVSDLILLPFVTIGAVLFSKLKPRESKTNRGPKKAKKATRRVQPELNTIPLEENPFPRLKRYKPNLSLQSPKQYEAVSSASTTPSTPHADEPERPIDFSLYLIPTRSEDDQPSRSVRISTSHADNLPPEFAPTYVNRSLSLVSFSGFSGFLSIGFFHTQPEKLCVLTCPLQGEKRWTQVAHQGGSSPIISYELAQRYATFATVVNEDHLIVFCPQKMLATGREAIHLYPFRLTLNSGLIDWECMCQPSDCPLIDGYTATKLDGHQYVVFGGISYFDNAPRNETWLFNLDTKSVQCLKVHGSVPQGVAHHSSTPINDQEMIIFGGQTLDDFSNTMHAFNVRRCEWIQVKTSQSQKRAHHTCFATSVQDLKTDTPRQLLIFVGGTSSKQNIDDVQCFDLLKRRWRQVALNCDDHSALLLARHSHQCLPMINVGAESNEFLVVLGVLHGQRAKLLRADMQQSISIRAEDLSENRDPSSGSETEVPFFDRNAREQEKPRKKINCSKAIKSVFSIGGKVIDLIDRAIHCIVRTITLVDVRIYGTILLLLATLTYFGVLGIGVYAILFVNWLGPIGVSILSSFAIVAYVTVLQEVYLRVKTRLYRKRKLQWYNRCTPYNVCLSLVVMAFIIIASVTTIVGVLLGASDTAVGSGVITVLMALFVGLFINAARWMYNTLRQPKTRTKKSSLRTCLETPWFPYWFAPAIYFLCWTLMVIASVILVMYGIKFQRENGTEKAWFLACFFGNSQNFFLDQMLVFIGSVVVGTAVFRLFEAMLSRREKILGEKDEPIQKSSQVDDECSEPGELTLEEIPTRIRAASNASRPGVSI